MKVNNYRKCFQIGLFQITSDDGKDLKIRSNGNITIRGNENVFIDSLKLNAMAKERIYFSVGKKVSSSAFCLYCNH